MDKEEKEESRRELLRFRREILKDIRETENRKIRASTLNEQKFIDSFIEKKWRHYKMTFKSLI